MNPLSQRLHALENAVSHARHHLANTKLNWTPGIPEAERDLEALTAMLNDARDQRDALISATADALLGGSK